MKLAREAGADRERGATLDALLGGTDEVDHLGDRLASWKVLIDFGTENFGGWSKRASRAEVLTASRRIVGRATSIGFGSNSRARRPAARGGVLR